MYYRFFKIIYVLRLWRQLKKLEYMKIIKYVYQTTYSSFFFILCINFLSISVYSILGMQLYKDKFNLALQNNLERNFNNFEKAFTTVFSIITMDNWDAVLIECMKVDQTIGAFYIFSLIFFLSFMMFNLLITVLIYGFENLLQGLVKTGGGRLQDEYNLFKVKQVLIKYTSFQEKIKKNSINNSLNHDTMLENYNFFNSKRSTNKTPNGMITSAKGFKLSSNERISRSFFEQLRKQKKFYLINFGINDENNCLFFGEDNYIRIFCHKINKNNIFHNVMYILLIMHIFFICLETFLKFSDDSNPMIKNVCTYSIFIIFFILSFETIVQSIDLGFILRNDAYLRNPANIINFLSVVSFAIEAFFYFYFRNEYLVLSKWSFFRILRSINITYQNEKMKLLLKAMFKSLRGLFSVSLVVLTVW